MLRAAALITLLLTLPAHAWDKPNTQQRQAIYGAIHTIKQVLGKDHPVVQKLDEIKLEDGFRTVQTYEFTGAEFTIIPDLIEFIMIDSKARLTLESANWHDESFLYLISTLLHEGTHLAYSVGDPEAGRLTAQVLRAFLPATPPQQQPIAAYEHYNCDQLRKIHSNIKFGIYHQMAHQSLLRSGSSHFEDTLSTYRHQIAAIDEDPDLSSSQKTQRKNSIRDRTRREVLELMHHWGGKYRFTCSGEQVDQLANAEDLSRTVAQILKQTIDQELKAEFQCDDTIHPRR